MMCLEELIKEFGDCVSAQAEAIANNDPRVGNRYAKRYIEIFEEIRSKGDVGRDALTLLLNDGRPEVRVMAASYLLRYCEDKARAVLLDEAKGVGLPAFGASQALLRWEEGSWMLDPE